MILHKFKEKYLILIKVLKFIYSRYTLPAILRDILFLISTFAELYGITVLGKFIDATTKILLDWKEFDLTEYLSTESFLYLALIFVLWVVVKATTSARDQLYTSIYERVWEDSECDMLSKVSSSNLEDVEKEDFQDMLTFIPSFSIDRITSVYENFSAVVSNLIRFVSAVVILSGTMGWTVLLLMAFVLPETVVAHFRRRGIRKYIDEEVGRLKFLNYLRNLGLSISNFSELRVNNVYSYVRRKYIKEYDQYVDGLLKKHADFNQDTALTAVIGQALKFAYVIYLLSFAVVKGLSFGTFKALYDYVDVVYGSIFHIVNSMSIISNDLGYLTPFFAFSEYEGFGDVVHGEKKLKKGTPSIEIKKLNFAYPDDPGTVVLKDINIKVEPGERVVLFGGDGSGKSTMVKILTGLYRINDGEYLIDDTPVQELDRGELKDTLSVTFQDFINYHLSLKENIVISGQRKNIDNPLYSQVTKIVGVDDFKKKLRLEDTSLLGKTFPSGKELSPGYWQRLAMARMLYRNKDIFLMDESFTFIDDVSTRNILENMFEFIGAGRSLIYITRSFHNLDMFDRIYYFDKGKIVESGSLSELMKKKGKLYEDMKGIK